MSPQRPRPWHNPTPLQGFQPTWAGQFDTFQDWVDHASQALTGEIGSAGEPLPAFCVDALGRRCHCGADFMRARDEGAFPIRYFWTGSVAAEALAASYRSSTAMSSPEKAAEMVAIFDLRTGDVSVQSEPEHQLAVVDPGVKAARSTRKGDRK